MMEILRFQIGKNGVTDGVIESLKLALKTHNQVRISVLQASGRNKGNMKEMADKIKSGIPNTDYRIIGFTIILIRKIPKKKPSMMKRL